MAGALGAVVVALGAGWMYVRRRWAAADAARVQACALHTFEGARRLVDDDAREAVEVLVRQVPVRVYSGAPRDRDPDWMTGLGAVARYVTEEGPRFRAGSEDPAAHLRAEGAALPLRALYGRTIPITGEHREARPLIASAFAAIEPTGSLTAPYVLSDGRLVSAWIARIPPPAELARTMTLLIRLVADLARWRDDVLNDYARAIGAVVSIDPSASPALSARLDLGSASGLVRVDARYVREPDRLVGARTFALRATGPTELSIPRERVPLDRLHPQIARRVPPALLKGATRVLLRGEAGKVVLEWARPPAPSELVAAVELLTALSPTRGDAGPFR